MTDSTRGLLIIVNHNQEQEIRRVLDNTAKFHPIGDSIVVDDGSTDQSPQLAEAAGLRVIRHLKNRGVGAAIRTGIQAASQAGYSYVMIMAANGKMKPSDLTALKAPIENQTADYVQGSRYIGPGGSMGLTWFRTLAIPVFTFLVSLILRKRFTDATCGFRAYTLRLALDPRMDIQQEWLDRYELEYYIHFWACRLNYRIQEVPVTMDYSHLAKHRKSKIRPFLGWWSMARPFIYLSFGIKK